MMTSLWTGPMLMVFAALLITQGATLPVRDSSTLTKILAPFVKHRLEEGRLPSALVQELVADFEDPDLMDFHDTDKRQFDEYGHMRFGKRAGGSGGSPREYDDYGHLRFGRSLSTDDVSGSYNVDTNNLYKLHHHHQHHVDGSSVHAH